MHTAFSEGTHLERLWNLSQDWMCIAGLDGYFRCVNPAVSRVLGYSERELLARHFTEFLHPEDVVASLGRLKCLSEGEHVVAFENRYRAADGSYRWLCWTASPGPEDRLVYAVARDITSERQTREHLELLAREDALTGTANRRFFLDRLHEVVGSSRDHGRRFAVLFVDLDAFKPINDRYGHDVGDRVLTSAARTIASCVRRSDLVGRIGGDEFVVLLPDVEHGRDAERICVKLVTRLRQPLQVGRKRVDMGASVGLACFPDDGRDADTLLRHADRAMYAAKEAGGRRFRSFASWMAAS